MKPNTISRVECSNDNNDDGDDDDETLMFVHSNQSSLLAQSRESWPDISIIVQHLRRKFYSHRHRHYFHLHDDDDDDDDDDDSHPSTKGGKSVIF